VCVCERGRSTIVVELLIHLETDSIIHAMAAKEVRRCWSMDGQGGPSTELLSHVYS
jgi:hypothetical protein